MKRYLLVLLLLASFFAPAAQIGGGALRVHCRNLAARKPREIPRTAAAPQAPLASEPKLVNKVLPNGLEIIVLEDHSVPLVTVELAVRNGSYTEPPELNGLSHLYEHMFFKANRADR